MKLSEVLVKYNKVQIVGFKHNTYSCYPYFDYISVDGSRAKYNQHHSYHQVSKRFESGICIGSAYDGWSGSLNFFNGQEGANDHVVFLNQITICKDCGCWIVERYDWGLNAFTWQMQSEQSRGELLQIIASNDLTVYACPFKPANCCHEERKLCKKTREWKLGRIAYNWVEKSKTSTNNNTDECDNIPVRNPDAGIYCLRVNKFVKVGMSEKSAELRAKSQLIPTMEHAWTIKTPHPKKAETLAHQILSKIGVRQSKTEWFRCDSSLSEIQNMILNLIDTTP